MKKILYILAGSAVGGLFAILYYFGFFSWQENFFQDLLFHPRPVSSEIVIVAIDDESMARIGQWPWPREIFARALNNLNSGPPLAVAMDVVFSEPSVLGEIDDQKLTEALATVTYPVILATEAQGFELVEKMPVAYGFLTPLSRFVAKPRVSAGQVNVIVDADGVVRRAPMEVHAPEGKIFSLAWETVRQVFGQDRYGRVDPVEKIVYAGTAGTIRRVPFWRVLENDAELHGKILFFGATALDLHDFQNVPFGRHLSMPGVEIQAHIANMVLNGYELRLADRWQCLLWIFLAGLLPGIFFTVFRRPTDSVILSIFLGAGYLFAVVLLNEAGVVYNILHLTSAWVVALIVLFFLRYFLVEKEKKVLKKIFSQYVSREVVEKILANPQDVRLGGEEKEVTVFFSDIRGFTTLSEKMSPTDLVELLNVYFTLMTASVLNHGGVLDKYIGDAIMAFWGAPIDNPNHADDALLAALEMHKNLAIFNKERQEKNLPPINIGIGLYTGPAVVGNMGSDLRMDYTVMGDTVNVASRLEGLNKKFGTKIIFGENTKNKLRDQYPIKFLGAEAVKGRQESVNLYTIDGI